MSVNLKAKEPDWMRSLFAFRLAVGLAVAFSALPAPAQIGSQHPLGSPRALAGQNRPLGGFAPSGNLNYGRRGNNGRAGYSLPYAFSFYVPNYFDSFWGADPSYYPPSPPPQTLAAPAPPVIINQYFSAPPPPYQAAASNQAPQQETGPSADSQPQTPAAADNYYLIAYKNHSVYTALAYWVEDKTLNYVTAGNTHNQASLDLIDVDLTKTLNQARGVPFAIAGK
ncbi:MAG TPA: hypothetical protein VG273_17805 [Bryobacteraceae bacterium]|jgi:hypothetical protein|nr:hypothetical protein [Bryobacteraceae bacterium]